MLEPALLVGYTVAVKVCCTVGKVVSDSVGAIKDDTFGLKLRK